MTSQALLNAQAALMATRQRTGVMYTPPVPAPKPDDVKTAVLTRMRVVKPIEEPVSIFKDAIEHHGDIAVAAMRSGQSSHYQLWLLLHFMDRDGMGRLDLDVVALHLTSTASKHKMWKRARMRQILAEGNGRFWSMTADRVYYFSQARVAFYLGVDRLNGRFVTITADQAKATSATFRAFCFAAWLANHRNPISQQAIERLTGITPRSQRRYCEAAGIERQYNLCVGPHWTQEQMQECCWQYSGTFSFVDFYGKQGGPGRRYVAWHLPVGYGVDADVGSRSRQRRVNKQIRTLAITEAQGNANVFAREQLSERFNRLFYGNGAAAAKVFNAGADGDVYWKRAKAKSGTGLWHVLQ